MHGLDHINALIATPESLSGILSADPAFAQRISLVICDEGHLLDSSGRGIGLELLLARMKARLANPIRFVFMSAIIPNIEEINAWLGGDENTVIRSTYRPAIAEFSVLRSSGTGVNKSVRLDMHPHAQQRHYAIHGFLDRSSFQYVNPQTGRTKTYTFTSTKTLAVGAARKVLSMGTTAIFAANKRGNQGAIGLAEELIKQLECPLPRPVDYADIETPGHALIISKLNSVQVGSARCRCAMVLYCTTVISLKRHERFWSSSCGSGVSNWSSVPAPLRRGKSTDPLACSLFGSATRWQRTAGEHASP